MSPAAVEIGSPVENFSSFLNPSRNFTTFVPESDHSHDQRSMDPLSSSSASGIGNGTDFGFGAASGGPSAKGRARPRLMKVRRHGARVRGAACGEIGSGFNPFASVGTPSNGDSDSLPPDWFSLGSFRMNKVNDRNGESCGNKCFVFGANGNCSAANLSSENAQVNNRSSDAISDKDESSTTIGDSRLCSEFRKGDSDGDLGKPDCDSQENIKPCSESRFSDVPATLKPDSGENGSWKNGVFVFSSSNENPDAVKQNFERWNGVAKTPDSKSCSDTSEKCDRVPRNCADGKATDYSTATNYCQKPLSNLPDDMKNLNINDTGDGRGSDSTKESSKANSKPAFVFCSSQTFNVEHNEAPTPSGSFCFSSNGFHQNDSVAEEQPSFHAEHNSVNSSTSTTCGTKISFNNFKVPQWDPSSFKNSFFPEVSRSPVVTRRNSSSKDKRSKKIKDKLRQYVHDKQNLGHDNVPKDTDSHEKFNSPGYYSPMDFSLYEDDTAGSQFTREVPQTSSKPSDAGDHAKSCSSNDVDVASARDESIFTTETLGSNCAPAFPFSSGLEDGKAFTFSAFSSQGNIPQRKRQPHKKYRRKVNDSLLKKEGTAESKQGTQSENTVQAKQGSSSTSAMPDACEIWRMRGNQAYRNGDLCKAEDCYTQGINSVSSSGNLEYCVKPLALCYSNRAAARISLGRLREAIEDCEMAASLDSNFIKVYMRAANCHLVLGELGEAMQYFDKCMASASTVCLDRRNTIEAAEGLQKAQRVADCLNRVTQFLEKKTPDAASSALDAIADALSISSCSEKLLQMKAEALFTVRRCKEIIELCESTLHIADRNSASAGSVDRLTNINNSGKNQSPATVWRWNMISKSHFYMGNLELALDVLQKLQQVESVRNENWEGILDSSASLVSTISALLHCKNAGNEAVRAGRYTEAVEHYTAALSRNVESRPFAAICFCNRAAANQALVQIADAIADCSLAMALDGNYTKAVSRRATLHEMIRDYGQAASDLQRLVSILEKQSDEKAKTLETSSGRASCPKDLRQARQRLSVMEEESKKETPLDFYLILGVKTSDTAADIKKAYRKAALRHHPDKAGQILVRSDVGDEGPWWKEIIQEVHKDADRLFKMIGEAYSVLSDPNKRSEYDLEEEIRKERASRESNRGRGHRKPSDASGYPFQRSPSRRYWRDSRKTHGSPPPWW